MLHPATHAAVIRLLLQVRTVFHSNPIEHAAPAASVYTTSRTGWKIHTGDLFECVYGLSSIAACKLVRKQPHAISLLPCDLKQGSSASCATLHNVGLVNRLPVSMPPLLKLHSRSRSCPVYTIAKVVQKRAKVVEVHRVVGIQILQACTCQLCLRFSEICSSVYVPFRRCRPDLRTNPAQHHSEAGWVR